MPPKNKKKGPNKPAPGVTFNMADMLRILGAQQEQQGQQMEGLMRQMDKSVPRPGVPNEVRGQGLGDPEKTGLTGYYKEVNPQMRPGEFDPTGAKSNRRRDLGYAREDALADIQFRNDFAQGLMDLQGKIGGQPGAGEAGRGDPMVTPQLGGAGGGAMMEHNVFDPLFQAETREDRRTAAADRDEADRAAYARATGQHPEELPNRWFKFGQGESPREQAPIREQRAWDQWEQGMKMTPSGQTQFAKFYGEDEDVDMQPGDVRFPMTQGQWSGLSPEVKSAIMAQAGEAGIKDFASYIVSDEFELGQFTVNNPNAQKFIIRPSANVQNPMSRWTDMNR